MPESSEETTQDSETPHPSSSRLQRYHVLLHKAWKWQPKPARYDPEKPPKFTLWLNILFGFASCFTVANLYYNQAILNRIAETFAVSFERASSVATLMQAGYAGGLVLICPLGDVFPRRPFIIGLVAFTATMWLGLCLTTSFPVFSAISFLTGFTTVTPQLMLPLVGDLAPAHRRASSLAIVVSGLSLGILVARILSGVMAAYTAWRNIYWFGLGVQWLVAGGLYIWLPDYPKPSSHPKRTLTLKTYLQILLSTIHLLPTEPLLLQASLIAFLLSAVFTSYWTTLSFLLSSPPFSYPSLPISLFGLIGIIVILSAPIYSRLVIDRVVPLASALLGLAVELAGVVVGTCIGSWHVAGPVVQAVTVDVGSQFTQIGMRAAIYGIRPRARNRVNTAYMGVSFCGQLTGTAVGNRLFAQGGWGYSGSCSIAFIVAAIIICLVRGPREKGWFGWSGGWAIRRDDLPAERQDVEAPAADTTGAGVTVVGAGVKPVEETIGEEKSEREKGGSEE
ncbi:major facilitator superfamily domain-containing protein [Dichotomopilus funicola]|uniref:Major facilitator superfamily domain-containing protein n=1 Tax=Dichotomopilus funicola TaxID=1934379 RepID=A0AAN6V8B6_9PEZI|nr:major facilitator superfamily domain-containing protein [Dichotomopilus funicola]